MSCGQSCDCVGEAPCDPSTGRCLCPPGRTGQRCEKGRSRFEAKRRFTRNQNKFRKCPRTLSLLKSPSFLFLSVSDCGGDRFGPSCSLQCRCSNRARCDGLSGRCLCPLTWLGPTCSEGKPKPPLPTHTRKAEEKRLKKMTHIFSLKNN